MADGLELRVLGPLELLRDGTAVSLGGVKPRMLLGTLALHHGRAVSTDQLIEVLWPADPPRSATANVQTYVSGLRGHLGPSRLQTRFSGYQLSLERDELDLARFDRLSSGGTLSELEDALALWRGQPMEGLPTAMVWGGTVDRLIGRWRSTRQARARLLIDAGRCTEALPDLRALVAEDPLREEAWHLLVRALAGTGQRAEALAAYAEARRVLAAELGIEPGEPLRRLHRELLAPPVSVGRLDADAATVLRGLARLAAPSAPAWVAGALLDRAQAPLDELEEARLLRRTHDGRYVVPTLISLLATDLPGDDAALIRLLSGYLFLADRAAKALPAQVFGPGVRVAPRRPVPVEVGDACAWFAGEGTALCRAVELAAALNRSDLAWELAHALVPWCDLGGHTSEWEKTHTTALGACRATGDLLGEAVTLRGLGQLHVYRDHYDLAAEAFSRARLLFARLGNDCGEAGALAGLGTVLRIRGELEEAYQCFRQVLASYVEADDLRGQAFAHGSLGNTMLARGDLDEAWRALSKGLTLASTMDDQHRVAHLTHQLGVVLLRKGDREHGYARLSGALDLFATLGDAHGQAYCLTELAELEPVDAAVGRLTQALDILERIGDRRAQAKCARRLGELHREAGRDGLGGAYLDEARRLQATVTPS
jgi:DNA-binding SARP family transcriptional activator/tetratricopeptide (TPR) repeat protein